MVTGSIQGAEEMAGDEEIAASQRVEQIPEDLARDAVGLVAGVVGSSYGPMGTVDLGSVIRYHWMSFLMRCSAAGGPAGHQVRTKSDHETPR
jgi:hypothetical protein